MTSARPVKLAFIGSHGVGKTTLCFDVAGALKRRGVDVDIVREVARQSPLPINRQTSLEAQMWILSTQVAEEIRAASQHEMVLCDRSVLDNYAYLARACGRHPAIETFVDYWTRTYEWLIKAPVTGRAAADGVRDVDVEFVESIDTLVDDLLHEKAIRHERLAPGARDQWTMDVLNLVCPQVQTLRAEAR